MVPDTVPPREPEPTVSTPQQAGRIDPPAAARGRGRGGRARRRPTSRSRSGWSSSRPSSTGWRRSVTGLADDRARRGAPGGGGPPAVRGARPRRPSSAGESERRRARSIATDDPNDIAIAQTLLGSVLDADDQAVREYLAAKGEVSADLVGVAERLVDARLELEDARARLVEARRASVAAQFNLAVFAAGSEIVIHGFVFPVGDPHSFGDSFGAPRMMGSELRARPPGHRHHGAVRHARSWPASAASSPRWAPTCSAARSSGSRARAARTTTTPTSAPSPRASPSATVVEAGDVVGLVGDTGNAQGRRAAPPLRDPPRRRAWRSTRTRCSRSSTSSASRPRHASSG